MRRGTPRRSETNQSFDEEIGKIPASYVWRMRRGTPRRSETNQSFDEEIGKIPASYAVTGGADQPPYSVPATPP
jgi:hypothetical protein